ncbi:formyltransferase family protein [Gammaproteobacteria bacterium]|nr:formyltransferase family protein [Gammaproteobacteria bacterium]
MTVRVGFIGCVDSSKMALDTLLQVPGIEVCAVISTKSNPSVGDFYDLSEICIENNIPMHLEDTPNKNLSADFLASYDLDIIFCIGWSRLLGSDILSLTPHGVVGFHPAALPSNRGRHPIIWALVLGLTKTASTFFIMDEGADSGPILSQEPVSILDTDNASSLYGKILKIAEQQIFEIAKDLVSNNLKATNQNHLLANTWRKRGKNDGMIDFRMSANTIHNLVRALAPPYPGAEFTFNQSKIKVTKTNTVLNGIKENFEPGKVLDRKGSDILVKTSGSGAIWLIGIENEEISIGEYL